VLLPVFGFPMVTMTGRLDGAADMENSALGGSGE